MSNSPLVSFTQISPARNSPRKSKIDTITIHCYVGQVTVERMGKGFCAENSKTSCNYGIGCDGRIGMYVEEKDRSWCSSNKANDNRAITIEVASDSEHPYAVTDAAYKSLINLLVDICKRNDIKELKWKADKKLIGKVDQQNMTVHRWFYAKECPGEYLYSRHGLIAKEVNARLNGVTDALKVDVTKFEKTDPADVWNFFLSKGLNEYAIAGLMGNLHAESALCPYNLQNTYSRKFNMTDEEYTESVDDGTYTNFVRDSAGYGLAQWTYWSRKQALMDFCKAKETSIGDLNMQLEFLWKELQTYKGVMESLNKATSVYDASTAVLTGYEKPANQSDSVKTKRSSYGQEYYDKYATGRTTTPVINKAEKDDSDYSITDFVKDIQKVCGAKVDGIPGIETISKTPTISENRNRKHVAVKYIQKRLYSIGYTEVGEIDGVAGSKFTAAVKRYQKNNECVVDGEITAKKTTWRKLLGMT